MDSRYEGQSGYFPVRDGGVAGGVVGGGWWRGWILLHVAGAALKSDPPGKANTKISCDHEPEHQKSILHLKRIYFHTFFLSVEKGWKSYLLGWLAPCAHDGH